MASENLETLNRIYAGWAAGDFTGGVAEFSEDATLHIDEEIPESGEYKGLEGIRSYTRYFPGHVGVADHVP